MWSFFLMVMGFVLVKFAETMDQEGYGWDACWVVAGLGALTVLGGAAIGLASR
jgi:hypothetical protein